MILDSPAKAVLETLPAEPGPKSPNPKKQTSNEGRRKLAIHLKGIESTRIVVRFELSSARHTSYIPIRDSLSDKNVTYTNSK